MGQALALSMEGRDGLTVAACFDRPDLSDARLVTQAQALDLCDVVIDFTTPAASVALAQACVQRGGPALVIGSTGLSEADLAVIAQAAKTIPIVQTGNFSLGVNMLMGLVAQTAKALAAADYDIVFSKPITAAKSTPHPAPR